MELKEERKSSQLIYRGRILTLRRDTVTLPNGREAVREVAEHPGGVGILALDGENRAALVRQYRYAFGQAMWEIPAGKREPGEEPLTTARRELQEEVGASAARWQSLGEIIPSPGCYGERLWLYLARELTLGQTHPDEDEFLELQWMPLEELTERCLTGELQDAKTIIAALKARDAL